MQSKRPKWKPETRPNVSKAACKRCGCVPELKMAAGVCPDCAEVTLLISRQSEKRREQAKAAFRRYYQRNKDRIKARTQAYHRAKKKAPVV